MALSRRKKPFTNEKMEREKSHLRTKSSYSLKKAIYELRYFLSEKPFTNIPLCQSDLIKALKQGTFTKKKAIYELKGLDVKKAIYEPVRQNQNIYKKP